MKKKILLPLIVIIIIAGFIAYHHFSYPYPKADISVTLIKPMNCSDCYNMTIAIDKLKTLNVNIKSYKELIYPRDISKRELLEKGITRLPVLIFKGEVLKYPQITDFWDMINGKIVDNFFGKEVIVMAPEPIYYNVSNDSIYGYVSIIEIKPPQCKECGKLNNMSEFRKMISHLCYIKQYLLADYDTNLSQELIKKYNITRLPAVIMSPEANDYDILSNKWKDIGITKKDGYLITTSLTPPFYSIPEKRVVGLINITYLYNPNCSICYNYTVHKTVLERFYVYIENEKAVSIYSREGKELVKKYNITAVPTFIASPDLKYYKDLMKVWEQVGTREKDGYFVFRNMKKMPGRIYFDLTLNKTRMGG